ncbi:MAG: Ig-like domain-containing protein, partial [Betaproteobacteria bacterium]
MSNLNSAAPKTIAIIAKGAQSDRMFEAAQGIGDRGQATRIEAQAGDRFVIRDPKSGSGPTGIRAKRVGKALHLFLVGSTQPDVVIENYFEEAVIAKPQFSLLGETEACGLVPYVIGVEKRPALSVLNADLQPITLTDVDTSRAMLLVNPDGTTGSVPIADAQANAALMNQGYSSSGVVCPVGVEPSAANLPANTNALSNLLWFAPLAVSLQQVNASSGRDNTPPAPPTGSLDAISDSGVKGDNLTSINTPRLSGRSEPGSRIEVTLGGKTYTTTTDSQGRWSVEVTDALTDGSYTPSVRAIDAAGNATTAQITPFTVDTLLIVQGGVAAGPMFGGATIEVYDNQGRLLGSAPIQSDGSWRITKPGMADYRGAILVKVVDANETGANFNDEVTGAQKSLDVTLRAMGVAQEGNSQFSTNGTRSVLNIYISPVTELAVRKAGVSGNTAPASTQAVQDINAAVGKSLGLSGVDITSVPTPTNSSTFNPTDGVNASEKYGLVLAKLSGLDSLNGGSIGVSLKLLEGNLSGQGAGITLSVEGLVLVDQGRQQALNALKAAPSASEKTFVVDTPLNRQLLGDVVVTDQSVTAGNQLAITGTALPGSTVIVTMPDGTVQTTVADAGGNFALTSTNAQPPLDTVLKLQGQDGLSLPATHAAPSAPVIDTGNGKVVAGTGQPGTRVEVFVLDANGEPLLDASGKRISLGQTDVDAAGHWSLTPAVALADNTKLQARTIDATGNVSAPGKGVVDIDVPGLSMPEAADGYINAAEKASDGGLALQITVPTTAQVGDVITTVLTLPSGSTETLTRTVTAADIGQTFTQIIPAAALAQEGQNKAAVTMTTTVGTSAPTQQSFIVDTLLPAAPALTPSNGQIINGTAEPGTTVTVRDNTGKVLGSAPAGADGNWTLLPAQPLTDGVTLTATATDPAGNVSGPGFGLVQVGALLITGAVDNVGPGLGLVADGAVTNDTSPLLSGTIGSALQPGQSAVVYRRAGNGSMIELGVADVQGNAWTFQDGQGAAGSPTAALVDGNYTYVVKIQSATGPVAGLQPSGEFDLTILTKAPGAPATVLPEASDAYVNAAERITDGGVPVVTTLSAGARVGDIVNTLVLLPGGGTRTLSNVLTQYDISAGRISQLLPASALTTDGAYSASTTLTSGVTGLTSPATVNSFTLDTKAPAAGTGALATASDTGALGDNKTNDNTPALSGTAEANATVSIMVNGQTYTTMANAQGAWSLPATATLPDGTYTPVITVTDAAGNSSTANAVPFTVDASAPSAPTVALPEAANGVSAAEAASAGGTPIVT